MIGSKEGQIDWSNKPDGYLDILANGAVEPDACSEEGRCYIKTSQLCFSNESRITRTQHDQCGEERNDDGVYHCVFHHLKKDVSSGMVHSTALANIPSISAASSA